MPDKTLQNIEDQFKAELKDAGNNEIKRAKAERLFYLRKMGWLGLAEPSVNGGFYNENCSGSYHPWSSSVIGESFGESGLKEFITLTEYLNQPPGFDDILKGVITGARKLAERNAAEAAKNAAKLKGKANEHSESARKIIEKGSK